MAKGNRRAVLAAALLLGTLIGCRGGESPARSKEPVHAGVRIERLDQDLFRAANDSAGNFSLRLYATYGPFYKMYVEQVLQAAAYNDPRLPMALIQFTHDPDWSRVQHLADSMLGDMAEQEAGFTEAFGRLKSFFPDSLVPRIIAYNSGFNYGVLPTDSVLGFGVEWFVGRNSPVVQYLSPELFPQYRKDRMRPDMLVPSVVKGWLQVHYTRDVRGEDLLTNLVVIGKVMALLDALLPGTDASLKFAFTPAQLKWCEDNEFNMWRELVANELLYSKDPKVIDRFLNDGPFTPGMPRESPGHIGEWIGHRLVESYLRANPKVTFAELFAMRDPQAILKTYKPR
ncbi:MAG: hypothetical protein KBH07_05130 [Flavobacteriales bacterium]|nr:hypothetical protein [Flavobacteriales bacterium]MBP9079425.1 hypothetical protein [Flavobacteriales bacterium]